jgi:hypothetical protein
MIKIVLVFVLSLSAFAKDDIVFPIGEKEIKKFLTHIEHMDPLSVGFEPEKVKILPENKEGSSTITVDNKEYQVYDIDINHDSTNEYVIIYLRGGSMNTSGILNVISQKMNEIVKADDYNISKVISKSLWNDNSGDLSKFHLFLARPFIVKRDNQFILRYLDTKPKQKITEYVWKNKGFKKIK